LTARVGDAGPVERSGDPVPERAAGDGAVLEAEPALEQQRQRCGTQASALRN
jgi:hypothetical protein